MCLWAEDMSQGLHCGVQAFCQNVVMQALHSSISTRLKKTPLSVLGCRLRRRLGNAPHENGLLLVLEPVKEM